MKTYQEYLQENLDNSMLNAAKQGDTVAFYAMLDKAEEEGRKIPPGLAKFRTPPQGNIHVRWMIRRDIPEIVELEKYGMPDSWDEATLLSQLQQRNNTGMVAEIGDLIVGYLIYNIRKQSYDIVRLVVHPGARKAGVGAKIIERLRNSATKSRQRNQIVSRDHPPAATGFFQKQGFNTTNNTSTYGINRT